MSETEQLLKELTALYYRRNIDSCYIEWYKKYFNIYDPEDTLSINYNLRYFYNILAIAVFLDLMPDHLPDKFLNELATVQQNSHLDTPADSDFLESDLHIFLIEYLTGYINVIHTGLSFEHRYVLLGELLDLINYRRSEPDINHFLAFINYGDKDEIQALKKLLYSGIKDIVNQPDNIITFIHGAGKLYSYILEYWHLLKRYDDLPLLQSAIWHLETSMFANIKAKSDLSHILKVLSDNTANWITDPEEIDIIEISSILEISSKVYSKPFENYISRRTPQFFFSSGSVKV